MVRAICLLLFFMAWSASAQTDTQRWEELEPPAKGQAVVDLSGTLKPETIQEVNRIAADLIERDQGRLVIVVVPKFSGELNGPAADLYDAWDVGGVRDDGAVIFLPLGANQAGRALGDALYDFTSDRGPLDAYERQIARTQEDRDGAVLGAAREMAALMAKAAPLRKPAPPATSPFAAFRRSRNGLSDPDRLLTAELASKTRERSDRIGGWTAFVVYDQSRHPVEARALAEYLNTFWNIDGNYWLVVVSTHPEDAWILPARDFGRHGGQRAGIPVAVEQWKQAAMELGRAPEGIQAKEAWNSALSTLETLADLHELKVPGLGPPRDELEELFFAALKPLALAVVLLLAGIWIWRRGEKEGPDSLPWFLVTGVGWTLVFGLSCAWVRGRFPIPAVMMTFAGSVLVFGGVRSLAAYFWLRPEWYRASACALAALGMLWTMMFFSSRLLEVGVMTRSIDVRELPGTSGGAFQLQGASVREEFSSVKTRYSGGGGGGGGRGGGRKGGGSSGGSSETQRLAPLVFEGWTPEQPVPAWLVCQYEDEPSDEKCNWDVTIRNATAPVGIGSEEQAGLIADAERTTTLRSAPGARLLKWSADAASDVREALAKGLLLPLAFLAAFVAAGVFGWRWDDPTGDRRR